MRYVHQAACDFAARVGLSGPESTNCVEACNNYERVKEERDALYEALGAWLIWHINDGHPPSLPYDELVETTQAALAKARGEA